MTFPLGQGVHGDANSDALLGPQAPITELIDPKVAPADMLSRVRVNTEGRCLETIAPIGRVAVEIYWKDGKDEETRGDFFPALDSELDPTARTNPLATQSYPYSILPDGSLYEVVVRAPLDAVDAEWSDERTTSIGGGAKSLFGISLAEFRRAYPGIEVDLPEGQYTITARERAKPTLAMLARVENGEPLTRIQELRGDSVRYRETLVGGFSQSVLLPDTGVAVINSRTTMRAGGLQADRQRLEFRSHDGFQRTGEGATENSGVVEIIVMEGEAVEYTGFTFTPFELPRVQHPGSGYDGFGYGAFTRGGEGPVTFGAAHKGFGGLEGGETRYRRPETVKVSMTGVRGLRAVAAFRFALAGLRKGKD